jgi:hypothetical protein
LKICEILSAFTILILMVIPAVAEDFTVDSPSAFSRSQSRREETDAPADKPNVASDAGDNNESQIHRQTAGEGFVPEDKNAPKPVPNYFPPTLHNLQGAPGEAVGPANPVSPQGNP